MKTEEEPQALLHSVLRLSPEPCCTITETEVHRLLTNDPLGYYSFVLGELRDLALGHTALSLPPKQIFADGENAGDFRVMPCVTRTPRRTIKTVKIVGTNVQQRLVPDQITVGKALVLHPEENYISHIIEACLLSSARTGICAVVAASLLADSCRSISVIGAGRVGYYSAFYLAAILPVERIFFADLDFHKAQNCARLLQTVLPGRECRAVASPFQQAADVVLLATTSRTALCGPQDAEDVGASLVISLGADTNFQHELDPCWPEQAAIYVDTMDSINYGDLRLWQEGSSLGQVTDLFTLLRDGVHSASNKRRLFISTGSALFDNLSIAYLLQQQERQGCSGVETVLY